MATETNQEQPHILPDGRTNVKVRKYELFHHGEKVGVTANLSEATDFVENNPNSAYEMRGVYIGAVYGIDDIIPDASVLTEEMNNYGYDYEKMLPVSADKALEFADKPITLYKLYSDNTESMVESREEIVEHIKTGGMFGIEKPDWEQYLKLKELSKELKQTSHLEKEDNKMNISVKVTPLEDSTNNVKALASVTLNSQVAINSIRIIEGEKGLFMQLPQTKASSGEYKDQVFPITAEARAAISEAVIAAYNTPEKAIIVNEPPVKLKMDVSLSKINGENTKAVGQVTIANAVVITGVKVVEGSNGPFVQMPSYKDKAGAYHDIAFPVTKACREQMNAAIMHRYTVMMQEQHRGFKLNEVGADKELKYTTLNKGVGEKIMNDLDNEGVKYSAKISDKVSIAINVADTEKFNAAVNKNQPAQKHGSR